MRELAQIRLCRLRSAPNDPAVFECTRWQLSKQVLFVNELQWRAGLICVFDDAKKNDQRSGIETTNLVKAVPQAGARSLPQVLDLQLEGAFTRSALLLRRVLALTFVSSCSIELLTDGVPK